MTSTPIRNSWHTIKIALPAPNDESGPYIPDTTKAIASARVRRIPKSWM